jgi:hypothetical protein
MARPRLRTGGRKPVAGKARDAEMASQMQQIDGADVSVEGDQVEIFRFGDQHHHSSHVHVLKVDP